MSIHTLVEAGLLDYACDFHRPITSDVLSAVDSGPGSCGGHTHQGRDSQQLDQESPIALNVARGLGNWSGLHTVLLGTSGGPIPIAGRHRTSQVLVVDGNAYVIDCGSGVVGQLVAAGIPLNALKALFITHLHSDHVSDYFSLVCAGRPFFGSSGFRGKFHVYGPGSAGGLPPLLPNIEPVKATNPTPGIEEMHQAILDAFAYTVNLHYIRNPSGPDIRDLLVVHDIDLPAVGASAGGPVAPAMKPFQIYEDDHVRCTAVLAHHPGVFPCFAFRFDSSYGSVVFSGDGTPSTNVLELAVGADLLVNEIMHGEEMRRHGVPGAIVDVLQSTHTDVTQVGRQARDASVRALALSHVVPLDLTSSQPITVPDERWLEPIRSDYAGPTFMGHDLMHFHLTDGGAWSVTIDG